jgi:CBS domain-containing protein
MTEASVSLLAHDLERLVGVPPFDGLPSSVLAEILAQSELAFYLHGKIICHPDLTEREPQLWLVRQGGVRATAIDDASTDESPEMSLGLGALFPLETALTGGPAWRVYTAAEDSFLWTIGGDALTQLLAQPAVLRWIGLQLGATNNRLRDAIAGLRRSRQIADQALALPVLAAGSGDIACVSVDATLSQVAKLMAERKIGSVVIGSPDAVVGLVTHTDLIWRGMAAGLSCATPVAKIMTPRPVMVDSTITVLGAGIEMARKGFRHLLLRSATNSVAGVVSERDLFQIQQQGIGHVFQPIDAASTVDEIADLAGRTREVAERIFRQGMEVSQFTRLLSSINDHLTRRLLSLIVGTQGPESQFCWLAFGSEGREEQGFVTDQDNGIIFVSSSQDVEAVRSRYVDMARQMNQALQRCGFDLCKGNIMAGNPEWCLSLDEWRTKFSRWICASTPTAILNATIFFDFRGIFGDNELAERLRDHLVEEIRGNTICLHMLAANALEVGPPLGRWNRFGTDDSEVQGTIDLKTRGSRLFVDAARIFALAAGVRTSNTERRLRAVGKSIGRAPSAIEGDVAAFRFIQTVRLRHQLDSRKGDRATNRIDPYTLNDLDQRMLRESLRQAQSLQERLRLDYPR